MDSGGEELDYAFQANAGGFLFHGGAVFGSGGRPGRLKFIQSRRVRTIWGAEVHSKYL